MRLSDFASDTYRFATSLGWEHGLLDVSELHERDAVLLWLLGDDDGDDPRNGSESEAADFERRISILSERPAGRDARAPRRERWSSTEELSFIPAGLRGRWTFTKGDPDPYPAVPHGHHRQKTQRWPKLNPYTGRVFKEKHAEWKRLRLSREEMVALWNDQSFRAFCLEHLEWFIERYPTWRFPVDDPMRLPRWR